jgi:hypothetical protein
MLERCLSGCPEPLECAPDYPRPEEKWADPEGQLSTNLALAGRSHFGYCNVRRNLKISRCLFTWSDIKDEVSQQRFVR